MDFDLDEITFALADALDLVGVGHTHHGKRVAYLATEIGRRLGWSDMVLQDLSMAAILHDFGLSSTREFMTLTTPGAVIDEAGLNRHSERGWLLLSSFFPFSHLAPVVLHHHTPWTALEKSDLTSEKMALMTNVIYLADRVEVLFSRMNPLTFLAETDAIFHAMEGKSGDLFSPQLVGAFHDLAKHDAFWLHLEPRYVDGRIRRWVGKNRQPLDLPQIRQLARLFGEVVDAKSRFTAEHSIGVGRLGRLLGQLAGMPKQQCDFLEIAGFLHDIGKLRIPDEILDKPGELTDQERAVVRRHTFDTYQILNGVRGFWGISEWAAFHHETPAGNGYPFGVSGPLLCLEAKIIAVADVFQALAQARPYRPPMTSRQVISILLSMAGENRLAKEVVEIVAKNLDICYQAAVQA